MDRETAAAPAGVGSAETSLRGYLLYFIRLGALGFGGPIALAGYMQKDLVEERGWVSKQDYIEGLALAQLSPGPLAAQLAMYLGWVRGGALGAAAIGIALVAPSFLMVLAIAWLYLRFGGLPWIQGVFYGIGAAVIAIIVRSTVKLTKLTLGNDWLLWVLFVLSGGITAITQAEIIWVFLACGAIVLIVRAALPKTPAALAFLPALLVTGAHGPASGRTLAEILW